MGNPLHPATIAKLKELFDKNIPVHDAAREAALSTSTVSKYFAIWRGTTDPQQSGPKR